MESAIACTNRAKELAALLNTELKAMLPPLFREESAVGFGFTGFWQHCLHTTEGLSEEEINKMCVEIKSSWRELLGICEKQNKTIKLIGVSPIVEVIYHTHPPGKSPCYAARMAAGFAAEKEFQQVKNAQN